MRSAHHIAAKSRANSLMPKANSEHRHFAREMPNQINADAGVLRRARTGRNHNALRLHRFNVTHTDLIVAADLNLRTEFPEILNQVIGKRVVVVENEDHKQPSCVKFTRRRAPRSPTRPLFRKSDAGETLTRRKEPSPSPRVVLTGEAF